MKTLRVDPLPEGGRVCNFDCIYCECASSSWPVNWDLRPQFPTATEIHDRLLEAATKAEFDDIDEIVICGRGEPTLSPHLDEIVDVVNAARDRDWPHAKTVIVSNGSMGHKPAVRRAMAKLDERIIKLDAGTSWIFQQVNRPDGDLSLQELLRRIAMIPDVVIQSTFVHGLIDNTTPNEVEAWLTWLARLHPIRVEICSISRPATKRSWVRPVSNEELQTIVKVANCFYSPPREEGRPRHQENAAKPSLIGADGEVNKLQRFVVSDLPACA